jgi:hypothetical protein
MRPFLAFLLAAAACATQGPRVALPAGDAERGRQAFRALFCYTCHTVQGEQFPPPTIPEPLALGKNRKRELLDAELVTAIVNPDHDLPEAFKARRMLDYSGVMTVQQLVDLVALLREVNRAAPAGR